MMLPPPLSHHLIFCTIGYHLLHGGAAANVEVVKRWSVEIGDALNSSAPMVQYHALGVMAKLREADRLAMSQLVSKVRVSLFVFPFFEHPRRLLVRLYAPTWHTCFSFA